MQPCFVFSHPSPEPNPDNSRYKRLRFKVPLGATLHGFIGYFHSTLYKDVHISIEPSTFSDGMFSWFPLYIPLRQPVSLSLSLSVSLSVCLDFSYTRAPLPCWTGSSCPRDQVCMISATLL